MSYIETHFGKLRKVEIDNDVTVEQWAEEKCRMLGISQLNSWCQTWVKLLINKTDNKYFFPTNLGIWEAVEHTELDEGDEISIVKVNQDSTIDFIVQFYNGGCSFGEVIEEELIKLSSNV